jgi:serine/threonine-protein kinase HipA
VKRDKNQLAIEKAKLAMALHSKRAHYRVNEITTRHWRDLAERTGISGLRERMLSFVASAEPVLKRLETQLPRNFPERVYTTIRDGVLRQGKRFMREMG